MGNRPSEQTGETRQLEAEEKKIASTSQGSGSEESTTDLRSGPATGLRSGHGTRDRPTQWARDRPAQWAGQRSDSELVRLRQAERRNRQYLEMVKDLSNLPLGEERASASGLADLGAELARELVSKYDRGDTKESLSLLERLPRDILVEKMASFLELPAIASLQRQSGILEDVLKKGVSGMRSITLDRTFRPVGRRPPQHPCL
jgi:hypothetical protein